MQRQTGSRIKTIHVPDTPSIAPVSSKDDKKQSVEPKEPEAVTPHSD
jgi:hypothetical protein